MLKRKENTTTIKRTNVKVLLLSLLFALATMVTICLIMLESYFLSVVSCSICVCIAYALGKNIIRAIKALKEEITDSHDEEKEELKYRKFLLSIGLFFLIFILAFMFIVQDYIMGIVFILADIVAIVFAGIAIADAIDKPQEDSEEM